jgi:hypothetical protein
MRSRFNNRPFARPVMLRHHKCFNNRRLPIVAFVLLASSFDASPAPAQQPLSIERLITDGWEVAGYVSAWENRSLILFKHKDRKSLVQCSVLIDVTRDQRIVITCYELK